MPSVPPTRVTPFLHGDDFVAPGVEKIFKWLQSRSEESYTQSTSIIGEGNGFNKETAVLNRLSRWHPGTGITSENDPRHVKVVSDEMR